MKRILILLGALIAVLIAAAVIVPFLIPTSVYKAQIETAASNALDREVKLTGDARLSILPVISARVDGVEIANAEGFTDPLMIEAGSLRADVKLWPLLSQRVEIGKITLVDATVRLERLADGRVNWQFGDPSSAPQEEPGSERKGGFETGIDRAALTNTAVYYNDRTTNTSYALTDFNANARMTALDKPFSSSGDGNLNGQPFDFTVRLDTIAALSAQETVRLDASLGTVYGDYTYEGDVTLAETPVLDGEFDIASDTIGDVLSVLGDQDLPIVASALDSIKARGTVKGAATEAAIDFEFLTLAATGLDFDYVGSLQLGAVPTLNGTVDLNAADAQRLLKPGNALIPILAMLGDVDLVASLSGPVTAPSLSGISLKQRSPDLSTDYTGGFSMGGNQSLDGMLDLKSDNPRAVLQALGTTLPEGDSLNRIAIKGRTEGTMLAPNLNAAELTLDDTTATGSVGADFGRAKPRFIADLTMNRLDLTPFLGSGSQQQDSDPSLNEDWDDTPLDLASLRAVDATVTIAASEVVMDQITLTDAKLATRLDDGRLSAAFRQDDDKPGFKVFQGNWSGDLVLDASRSTPTMQIEAVADSIVAQDMLSSLTGFTNLTGLGDVHIDLTSQGNSIKALVNGLDGKFETDLADGVLRGLNLAKLVQKGSNLQELLSSGSLSIASFREAISPEATTDFSQFLGSLDIANGVATLTDLKIDNPAVGVLGSGQIDLGARTLDIRLTPRVDVNAAGAGATFGVADIPVPVRVYGSWSNVRFGLDSSAVQAELTSRLRNRAANELANRIGGDAGGLIGEIVGASPAGDGASEPTESRDLEDELRDRALGALFGNSNRDQNSEENPD